MYSVTTDAVRHGMQPRDIFIFHNGENIAHAHAVIYRLETDYGWKCWYPERDIPPDCPNRHEIITQMIEDSTVFLLLSSDNATNSQAAQMVASLAMALEIKRIELNLTQLNDRALSILNYRLHGLIKKRGTSYRDADFVDEGIIAANKIGLKALVLLFVAVVGGFVAVRAFDVLMVGSIPGIAEAVPNHANPDTQDESHLIIAEFLEATRLAMEGDPYAQYNLANMYIAVRNVEAAAYWYRKAAESHHLDATLALARLYWNESEPVGNRVEGFIWFHNAAQLGHTDTQHWIAGRYRTGATITAQDASISEMPIAGHLTIETTTNHHQEDDGTITTTQSLNLYIPQDYERAYNMYRQAAMQGHTAAQTSLGVMYILGEGTTPNPEQAVYWYKHAATSGNSAAQGNLGIAYMHGQGVAQCSTQAAYWFNAAATQNNASAQVNLAWMYENGHIGDPDLEKSFYWNQRAANLGNIIGQTNTGLMYLQGRGVDQCLYQAAQWLNRSAERGCERAIYSMGVLYEMGITPDV